MAEPTKKYRVVVVQTVKTEYEVPAYSQEHAKQLMEDAFVKDPPAETPVGMVEVLRQVERTVVKRSVTNKETAPQE